MGIKTPEKRTPSTPFFLYIVYIRGAIEENHTSDSKSTSRNKP